jgi:vancomycin permeability regulator SanA
VESVGVAADFVRPEGYSNRAMLESEFREFPATAVSVLDLLRNEKPYYLGDPLPIFGS